MERFERVLFYLPSLHYQASPDNPSYTHHPGFPRTLVLVVLSVCFPITLRGTFDIPFSGKTTGCGLKSLEGQLEKEHLPSNSCHGR